MAKEKQEVKISNKDYEEYIKDKINEEVEKAVRREEKKLLRHKNGKIIKRDIIILILIFFYLLLGYNLYNTNYFDKFINKYFNRNNVVNEIVESSSESTVENDDVDIKKYESLLDNYKLYQNSEYLNNYFSEKMSDEVKMELVFNYLSKDDFKRDGNILTIGKDRLDEVGKKLFTEFNSKPFNYFGSKVYFIDQDKEFLLNEKKLDSIIPIEVKAVDIEIEDNSLELDTIIYYVKDNKVYNVFTNKEVVGFTDSLDVKRLEKDLTVVKYEFEKNNNGEYVLKNIDKELE